MPQAHGGAEAGVKIVKNILRQKDMFTALRTYRCTPTVATGYRFTPYELMIGRNPCIYAPCSHEKLLPKWPKYQDVKNAHNKSKAAQEYFYNM